MLFFIFLILKKEPEGIPWWSSGEDCAFTALARVQSLVRKLRFYKLYGTAKTNKRNQRNMFPSGQ